MASTKENNKIIYLLTMCLFLQSYKEGLISKEDYLLIEEKVMKKTGINPLSVYRLNDKV